MPYDYNSRIWPDSRAHFFTNVSINPLRQNGPHCVSTCLGMLTGLAPEHFQTRINTQNPSSWSDALRPYGMQLAYCSTDVRKIKYYIPELVSYEDLFVLCYYTSSEEKEIMREPDPSGWLTGSHIVILQNYNIFDPARGIGENAYEHSCNIYHTKRIFRVVPTDHPRRI